MSDVQAQDEGRGGRSVVGGGGRLWCYHYQFGSCVLYCVFCAIELP